MKRSILIDDMREIAADVVCRCPDDGVQALIHMKPFDILYLDHDMGFELFIKNPFTGGISEGSYDYSGYGVACFIEQHPEHGPKEITVVSSNPAGVNRIRQALFRHYDTVDGRHFIKRGVSV